MTIEELEQQLARAEELLKAMDGYTLLNVRLQGFEDVSQAQRELAAAKGEEYATPYDIGVTPEAAVSGPVVLQTDYNVILTFNAMKEKPDGYREDAGTAIVEFKRCIITKFGYPNDEARWGHPLGDKGLGAYGVYEIMNSTWIRQLTDFNRIRFPNTPDSDQRHFMFTFHDSTFECIADGMEVRVSDEPYEQIFAYMSKRTVWRDADIQWDGEESQ